MGSIAGLWPFYRKSLKQQGRDVKIKYNIKAMVLATLVGSLPILSSTSVNAGGMIDLNFENFPTIIGMGVGVLPDHSGSNEYTYGFAPFFRYTFKGQQRYVQLMANELTVNVLNDNMFRIGPLAAYKFSRSDDVEDPAMKQMTEIDDSVEVGGFAEVVWTMSDDNRQRFILGAKLYQDVGDVSEGFHANLSARYWQPVAKPVDLNLSLGFIYQDDKYANTYYGVNAENVGASGLSFFNAGGGANEYYGVVAANFYLSKNWIVGVGVHGSVLAGDPGDSPIVDQRGSSTQWIGGIGLGYVMW
jgi:MipA family protein